MCPKKRWSWGLKSRRLTRPDDFSQLPEQLREKLTGSQSFQQTQVLAGEAVSPEEIGSWGKEGST